MCLAFNVNKLFIYSNIMHNVLSGETTPRSWSAGSAMTLTGAFSQCTMTMTMTMTMTLTMTTHNDNDNDTITL